MWNIIFADSTKLQKCIMTSPFSQVLVLLWFKHNTIVQILLIFQQTKFLQSNCRHFSYKGKLTLLHIVCIAIRILHVRNINVEIVCILISVRQSRNKHMLKAKKLVLHIQFGHQSIELPNECQIWIVLDSTYSFQSITSYHHRKGESYLHDVAHSMKSWT